jgi:hypothetical protein
MNKRRRFLLGGLGVAALAGLGAWGFGPLIAESEIVSLVRRRLAFLKLDEAGLHAFAKDQTAALLAKRPTWNRMKYHFLSVFSHSFTRYNVSNDKRSRSERLADSLSQTYLLSSDFFVNGAQVSRVVQYRSLYDPMVPCGNPFARPPVDIAASS